MRSRHRDRLLLPSFAEAAARKRAGAGAVEGSSPVEAGHRKLAEEEEGSIPAEAADRSLAGGILLEASRQNIRDYAANVGLSVNIEEGYDRGDA